MNIKLIKSLLLLLFFPRVRTDWTYSVQITDKKSFLQWFGARNYDTSNTCCSDPTVSPFYYSRDNVQFSPDSLVTMMCTPIEEGTNVLSAGFQSKINSFLYGSFSATVSLSNVSGAVFSMFLFNSVVHELDVEVLTRNWNSIYFANQPVIRDVRGNSLGVSNRVYMGSDMTKRVKYRIDWFPHIVQYYVNEVNVVNISVNVPNVPTNLVFILRSNNNTKWSGIFPTEVVYANISDIAFSFNSTVPIVFPNSSSNTKSGKDLYFVCLTFFVFLCMF